jgi:carboxylesterase
LGQQIHQAKFTVLGIKLSGHGTNVEEFSKTDEHDWIKSAVDGYKRLAKIFKSIYVIGHSMGGLLAMYIAENYPVEKLILLAPALSYRHRYTLLAGVFSLIIKDYAWPIVDKPPDEAKYLLQYPRFPMKSVHYMNRLQKLVRKHINRITAETLLILARNDTLVHPRTKLILGKKLTSPPMAVIFLQKSGHSVAVECEKETVFKECINFLQRRVENCD